MSDLKQELDFFQAHLSEWLAHYDGKFALIKGESLVDTFSSAEDAYSAAVSRFGTEDFLIKQITKNAHAETMPAYFLGLGRTA